MSKQRENVEDKPSKKQKIEFNKCLVISHKEVIEKQPSEWSILVRVSHKDELATFKKDNRNRFRFNFKIFDKNETQLDCIGFDKQAEDFFPKIKEGMLYYISNGIFKLNSFNNTFQVYLTRNTIIQECKLEHKENKKNLFNPIKINKINKKPKHEYIGKLNFFVILFSVIFNLICFLF